MNRREVLASVGAASLLPGVVAFSAPASAASSLDSADFGATLQLGSSEAGEGNHRWAPILGGVTSSGRIIAGRLDWHVDPASGAVEAAMACRLLPAQGQPVELHRTGLQAVRLPQGLVRLSAFNAT